MRTQADVTFHPSWWHTHAGVSFTEPFFFDVDYRIEADRKMRRVLYEYFGDYGLGEADPQPRPILFSDLIASGFLYSQLLGCRVQFAPDDAPQVCAAHLTDEQVEALEVPDLDQSPLWQRVEAQIETLRKRFGFVESAVNLMGIQNIALDLRGEDLFLDYYEAPELAHRLLGAAARLSLDIGKRLCAVSDVVSGGVSAIIKQVLPGVYLTSNCSVAMISQEMYCEQLLDYDRQLAQAFPVFGVHHCGSNLERVVEGYLQIPQLKLLEVGAGSNVEAVAQALRQAGREDVIACIRYSPVKLRQATKAEIQEETDRAIRAFGSDRNLCFSCVGIDNSVSVDQVRAYLSVFREPIRKADEL